MPRMRTDASNSGTKRNLATRRAGSAEQDRTQAWEACVGNQQVWEAPHRTWLFAVCLARLLGKPGQTAPACVCRLGEDRSGHMATPLASYTCPCLQTLDGHATLKWPMACRRWWKCRSAPARASAAVVETAEAYATRRCRIPTRTETYCAISMTSLWWNHGGGCVRWPRQRLDHAAKRIRSNSAEVSRRKPGSDGSNARMAARRRVIYATFARSASAVEERHRHRDAPSRVS